MGSILKVALVFVLFFGIVCAKYEPNWDSLDARPLPKWYDEGKIGIFLHWGVFSVPSFKSEWFWEYWKGKKLADCVDFMKENYPPSFTYADFAREFTAEFYNPEQWAELFQAAGAKYVVLTSKHHEGFTNWPSKHSFNWNAMAVGPNRDLVGDLATAIRNKTDLHFGLYHSMFEWFNPEYLQDAKNNFQTQDFVRRKTLPELYELVNNYKPDLIWSDGDGDAPYTYWNSTNFLAWLYNDSPVKDTVVVNDRWGKGMACHHGGYYTCQDRYNPGKLQNHKWENAMTIDKSSWGYRRNTKLDEFLTTKQLISTLIETVSCGGNILINVGPTKEGTIIPLFENRLRELGNWLKVNGEAIYSTTPYTHQNDSITPNVWYTKSSDASYAIFQDWPKDGVVMNLGSAGKSTPKSQIQLVGYKGSPQLLKFAQMKDSLKIWLPVVTPDLMPCEYAWVLKFINFN